MDVTDLRRKQADEVDKKVLIFNPLSSDLEWKYDGQPQAVIPSMEMVELEPHLAKIAGDLLVDLYTASKDDYPRSKAEKMVFPND